MDHKVDLFFLEMPMGLTLTFMEGKNAIGPAIRYPDPDRIYELLRRARAPQEDHHIVAMALQDRRPGRVTLRLTDEQYWKLKQRGRGARGKGRV